MKLGTENRTQLIALGVLGFLALVLLGRIILGVGDPTPTVTAPIALDPNAVSSSRPAARVRVKGKRAPEAPHSIDPSLRYEWLKSSEETKYEGNGRNIFMLQAEIPTPVAAVTPEASKPTGPPPPPPPPPITLKFYGFASKPGEPKRVFLSQGEDLFIASEGEIVDRRYKVLHITPVSVEIEDVLNNNRQSIPLTQG